MRLTSSLVLLCALVFLLIPAAAQAETVEAEGVGIHYAAAEKDALRNAVAIGIGTYIRSRTVVRDFIVQDDRITQTSFGFVTGYKLLSKGLDAGGVYRVRLLVSLEADRKKAASILEGYLKGKGFTCVVKGSASAGQKIIKPEDWLGTIEAGLLDRGLILVPPGWTPDFKVNAEVTLREGRSELSRSNLKVCEIGSLQVRIRDRSGKTIGAVSKDELELHADTGGDLMESCQNLLQTAGREVGNRIATAIVAAGVK